MNAPKPPDPIATARGQFLANTGTAIAQQAMNQTNQVNPFSSLTYNQTGTHQIKDSSSGRTYDIPTWTATTSSPYLDRLGEHINSPFDANEETQRRLTELSSGFLTPEWDRRRQELESNLLNRGLGIGTEAYKTAVQGFEDSRTRAYNDMLLSGRGQAFGEAQYERQRPINEIMAAVTGTPFGATPSVGISPPDYQGAVQANYAQRAQNYSNMIGGIAGLAGTVLGGALGGPLGASLGGWAGSKVKPVYG